MQSSRKWCKAFVSRHKRSQTDLRENHNIAELVQKFLCPVFQWLLSCVSPRASEWLFAPLNVGEPSLHARRSKSADMGLVGKNERCPVNKNKHRCRNIIQRIKCCGCFMKCGLVLVSYKSRTGSSDVSGVWSCTELTDLSASVWAAAGRAAARIDFLNAEEMAYGSTRW